MDHVSESADVGIIEAVVGSMIEAEAEVAEAQVQPIEVQPDPPFSIPDIVIPTLPTLSTSSKSDKPEIRALTVDEVREFVEPVFTENGALLPSPTSSMFVGAVKDGKVVAFVTVQSVIHTEPLWVEEGSAAIVPRLVSTAEDMIGQLVGPCKVYFTAVDDRVCSLAERLGMTREPGAVFTRWVDGPAGPVGPTLVPTPAPPQETPQ